MRVRGGRSDPRSTRAEGHTGSGDPTGPSGGGRGSGRRVPVLAADPEDDRDGAEPGDDTGDEVEGHDAALLTLVGWSMRRPQMTPSIVIPSRGRRTRRGSCRCRRSPRVFLDRRDEVRRAEEGDGVADLDVVGGTVTITTPIRPWSGMKRAMRSSASRRVLGPEEPGAGGTRGLEGDGRMPCVRPAVDGAFADFELGGDCRRSAASPRGFRLGHVSHHELGHRSCQNKCPKMSPMRPGWRRARS